MKLIHFAQAYRSSNSDDDDDGFWSLKLRVRDSASTAEEELVNEQGFFSLKRHKSKVVFLRMEKKILHIKQSLNITSFPEAVRSS